MNISDIKLRVRLSAREIVRREGELLLKTDARLFKTNLDAAWVARLENEEDLAERLDAFVSRFGRMQDTLGDKLIPSLLRSLAEKPGSALNQAHLVVTLLVAAYNAINLFAHARISAPAWPNLLSVDS